MPRRLRGLFLPMVAIHWAQLKTTGNGSELELLTKLFRYIKETTKKKSCSTQVVINWLQNWCNECRKLSMWHLGTWMGMEVAVLG